MKVFTLDTWFKPYQYQGTKINLYFPDDDDDDDSGGGTINPIIKDFTEFQVMLGVFGVILLLAMMSSIVITLSKYFCKASLKDRGDKITFLLAEEQSDFKMEVASDDDDMKL